MINLRGSTDASEVPTEKGEERVPPFAVPFVGLFQALSALFKTQQLGEAHARAAKLFHDVEKGHQVDPYDLLEVCRYRVAVEMGRVYMNNMIRKPASTVIYLSFTSIFLLFFVVTSILSPVLVFCSISSSNDVHLVRISHLVLFRPSISLSLARSTACSQYDICPLLVGSIQNEAQFHDSF